MKTFKLDNNGDVVIENNKIEMVSGMDFIAQTIKQVLNTNIGEWFGDEEEGIDYSVILTKNPDKDLIQDTINTAIQKVASDLDIELDTDNFGFTVNGRELTIYVEIIKVDTDEKQQLVINI